MENSSTPGSVDSIHIDSEQQTVIIMDSERECGKLLKYMRDNLPGKEIFT